MPNLAQILVEDDLQVAALSEMLTRFEAKGATPRDLVEYFTGVTIGIAQANGISVEDLRVMLDDSYIKVQKMVKDFEQLEAEGKKG